MKNFSKLSRLGALFVGLLMSGTRDGIAAQTANVSPSFGPVPVEDLTQAELLKAYRQLRDELHATQIAAANNRAEADAASLAQATAFAEKLNTLSATAALERERQQREITRSNIERDSQQSEMQRLTRTILWVAAVFGGVGLVVMLLTPVFQWRAVNCMAELAAQRPQAPMPYGLLPPEAPGASEQTVALSNQRLLAVIDRMERRIVDMEQTANQSPPGSSLKASTVTALKVDPAKSETSRPGVRPR